MDKENFDFDALKDLWQNNLEGHVNDTNFISNQQILTIMKEKTSSAVQKVRRNLLIEVLITIPMFIATYYFFQLKNIQLPNWAWAVFVLTTFSYHIYLYWKLSKTTVPTDTVLDTVKKQKDEIGRFVKMYNQFAVIGGIFFLVANTLVFYRFYKDDYLLIGISFLLSLCSGYGFFVFMRWYTAKLYGKYHTTLVQSYEALRN